MSSTTDEERREAATNLRKIHLGGANKDLIELMLSDAIGARHENGISWDYITERLAYLIDPTCHLVSTTFHSWSDGSAAFYHELSCGHICETVWGKPPPYCPECGARLVTADE